MSIDECNTAGRLRYGVEVVMNAFKNDDNKSVGLKYDSAGFDMKELVQSFVTKVVDDMVR